MLLFKLILQDLEVTVPCPYTDYLWKTAVTIFDYSHNNQKQYITVMTVYIPFVCFVAENQQFFPEHDNVVAAILHGGQASTIEAAYFGKPLLGVPFFADQFNNIKKITRRNGGIQLDLDSLTEEKIAAAVKDITTNPK